jgi:hypothetical protein
VLVTLARQTGNEAQREAAACVVAWVKGDPT